MFIELLSMLGGGVAGFFFRMIAMQSEANSNALEMLIKAQGVSDESADKASKRGTHIGRRAVVFTILWVVALAPFVGALLGIPTFVESDRAFWDIFGIFTGGFEKIQGIVLLDEFRVGLLACVGYYLGSSAVGRSRA